MINNRNISILLLCIILTIGVSRVAAPGVSLYPKDIHIGFEYDDNVTRARPTEDYRYGVISRLTTGFGIKNFVPANWLTTNAEYTLRMRDVNTTNNEDYSSQLLRLSSISYLKTGTRISLRNDFRLWNSQSDLFNFYDNTLNIEASQPVSKQTTLNLLYSTRQKWFHNRAPEVQARNFLRHQMGLEVSHDLSESFTARVRYDYGFIVYNRSPIDFKNNRPIALDGVQKDWQSVISLGGTIFLLGNNVTLNFQNQIVRSDSNSPAFDFDGNRARLWLHAGPIKGLSADFIYKLVAYNVGAYQTPDFGYELTEARSDDQSMVEFRATYDISDQVSLEAGYQRIENTVFFTTEFYEENIFSIGTRIKF